jgi:hypothetical protein
MFQKGGSTQECEAGRRQHLAELQFVVLTNLRNSGGAGLRPPLFIAPGLHSSAYL